MIRRPLIALAFVLAAAGTAQAQAHYPIGGATTPRPPLQVDALGPRSDPTPTVGEAVARVQIEKAGYTGVRGLWRAADGTWHGKARNASNAAVPVALDNQGKVTETR
ncbi:MAG TPA: hypothetical protein VE963_01055 [Reyranella sp.]|nr:hypothetical protein [Reyranella sp.]